MLPRILSFDPVLDFVDDSTFQLGHRGSFKVRSANKLDNLVSKMVLSVPNVGLLHVAQHVRAELLGIGDQAGVDGAG